MMESSLGFAALVVLALMLALFIARRVLLSAAQKSLLKTKPSGKETPADVGLPFEDFRINSGDRRLQAWWVNASPTNDASQAVLIFHGNAETISNWIPVQQLLWSRGISSMVFDYSGFGDSDGKPNTGTLREDVKAALETFKVKVGDRADKYLLALSLGSGFLLDAPSNLTEEIRGVILIAAYSSVRDVLALRKMLPAPLTFLFPDIYNNVRAVSSIHIPVLIVHSADDQIFPATMAQQIYDAANEPKRLVVLDGLKHNDMLEGKAAEYLAPVIEFLKSC